MVQVSLAFNVYGHYFLTALDRVRFRYWPRPAARSQLARFSFRVR